MRFHGCGSTEHRNVASLSKIVTVLGLQRRRAQLEHLRRLHGPTKYEGATAARERALGVESKVESLVACWLINFATCMPTANRSKRSILLPPPFHP